MLLALHHLNDALCALCKIGSVVLIGAIAGIMGAHVVFRYALNAPLFWAEEVSRYLMVWSVFLGAPLALRSGEFIAFPILKDMLGRRSRAWVTAFVHLCILGFLLLALLKGYELAWRSRNQIMSTLDVSFVYIYASLPIGAALMLLVSVEAALTALVGSADQETR